MDLLTSSIFDDEIIIIIINIESVFSSQENHTGKLDFCN